MTTAILSSKNQIAIPELVLQLVGLQSGDRVEINALNEAVYIKPLRTSIVESLAGSIKISKGKIGIPFAKVLTETKKIAARELAK